jgi:hypothetical protein
MQGSSLEGIEIAALSRTSLSMGERLGGDADDLTGFQHMKMITGAHRSPDTVSLLGEPLGRDVPDMVQMGISSIDPISATRPPARRTGTRDSRFASQRPRAIPETSRSAVDNSNPRPYHTALAVTGNPMVWA